MCKTCFKDMAKPTIVVQDNMMILRLRTLTQHIFSRIKTNLMVMYPLTGGNNFTCKNSLRSQEEKKRLKKSITDHQFHICFYYLFKTKGPSVYINNHCDSFKFCPSGIENGSVNLSFCTTWYRGQKQLQRPALSVRGNVFPSVEIGKNAISFASGFV